MDKKNQQQLQDLLLATHQFLEGENVEAALRSPAELATTKGVIARLVLIIANTEPQEEGK
jgi:hypothetical protein